MSGAATGRGGGRAGAASRGAPAGPAPRRAPAVAALAAAVLLGTGPAAPAQEAGPGPEEPDDPPLVEAPTQFWVGPAVDRLAWEEGGPEAQSVEDATMAGLEVGTRVSRYLGFRFAASFGRAGVAGADSAGVRRAADINQWLVEVAVQPRIAAGPWAAEGVVPYLTLAAGGLVHDPRGLPSGVRLLTRSQGFLGYGAGVAVEPDALGPFGLRAEWREADVQLQPMFRPTVQEGEARSAGGLRANVYVTF